LSVSRDGTALLGAHIDPQIWVAPAADVSRARLVLRGDVPRDEGRRGLAWTPDGSLLYTAYIGESQTIRAMGGDGNGPRQLTPARAANSFDNEVRVSRDGRHMVFHSNRSGDSEIWRANTDGSDPKQLTTGGGNSQPSLSPDGQWVMYASARGGKQTLWRIPIDGGVATQLTERSLAWPEVSPDGKYVACIDPEAPPRWRLTVIASAGGGPLNSFAVPESVPQKRALRWTPDGKAIIYQDSFQGLWRQALNEESPRPVKGFEELRVFQFLWSFDGQSLAYTVGEEKREIILMENLK
jgi:dipeptidyl aminopeptidase/acylaminoacyl peptidase